MDIQPRNTKKQYWSAFKNRLNNVHHKWLLLVVLVAPFLGMTDTGYLTAKHYSGAALTCGIFNGCDAVTTSVYSTMFGIPLALLGFGYYAAVAALFLLYAAKRNTRALYAAAGSTSFGFAFSLWLLYLQVFVIKALCSYCLLSAGISAVLFGVGALLVMRHRRGSASEINGTTKFTA